MSEMRQKFIELAEKTNKEFLGLQDQEINTTAETAEQLSIGCIYLNKEIERLIAELVEYKEGLEGLEWLASYVEVSDKEYVKFILSMPDCPAIIKRMIGEKHG